MINTQINYLNQLFEYNNVNFEEIANSQGDNMIKKPSHNEKV